MTITIEAATEKLDSLLALLAGCSASEACDIVQEHVQEARTYLLGAMDAECRFSLDLAREAAVRIPDRNIRIKAENVLSDLVAD